MKKVSWRMLNFSKNANYRYSCVKSIVFLFKLIGLAPMTVVKTRFVGSFVSNDTSRSSLPIKFVYSPFGSIYNVSIATVVSLASYTIVQTPYENDYPYKTRLTMAIELIQTVSSVATIAAIWVMISLKQTKMVDVLNRLMKFDSSIHDLTSSKNAISIGLYMTVVSIANTIIWLSVIVTDIRTYCTLLRDWAGDIIPAVIISWFIIQYALLVRLLQQKYRNLNRAIIEGSRSPINMSLPSLSIDRRSSPDDFRKVSVVNRFRRAHTALYEIAYDIAELYSVPILFVIALNCLFITYNTYFVVMPLVLKVDTNPWLIAVASILWLFGLFLPIVVLTRAVDDTRTEMGKSSESVHKVLGRSETSREDKSELEQFSIELLERKVEFTALGMFPLDSTLVQSIFNMVVTYFVILLQFQMSETKKKHRAPSGDPTIVAQ